MTTRKYSLEHKYEWNLSQVWFFLTTVIHYLNCLDRVVLAHPFWALAAFPVCFFLSLAVGQIQHLSRHLPPSFYIFVVEAGCLQATPIALMALWVCLLMFPLSAILLIRVTISSPRESSYRCLWLFFFCCQLVYFSIHSTNAFTQATSIKLRNNVKGQQLVDLVQVYSLTSLSRMLTPLFVAL